MDFKTSSHFLSCYNYFCAVKIAIIGYGKMGKTIEKICIERGHQVTHRFDADHPFEQARNVDIDVAIEFTSPELAVKHITHAVNLNIPIVVGTTGWYEEFERVINFVSNNDGSLFYATNFSIGVNLFFQLNKVLAGLISKHPYTVSMTEIHHTEKKDAPSGTAITLAEGLIQNSNLINQWKLLENSDEMNQNNNVRMNQQGVLPILAERLPDVPGTHIIKYESDVDSIEIRHEAKNRLGFALGSVLAAEWLVDKKGVFNMSNMLSL